MRKIGIICAMEMEAEALRNALSGSRQEKRGAFSFTAGTYMDKEVILGLSGIGKVAAAVCTQTLLLSYAPDAVLNVGVAGSLSDDLEILDVALSTALVQHDMDTTPLGDPPGFLSGPNVVEIPADPTLLAAAEESAKKLGIRTRSGMIATGDQFIATQAQKAAILAKFPAIACEMEGGAVAQTAYLNGTPFLILRAISDSCRNEMDFTVFAPRAAQRSAELLLATLKRL